MSIWCGWSACGNFAGGDIALQRFGAGLIVLANLIALRADAEFGEQGEIILRAERFIYLRGFCSGEGLYRFGAGKENLIISLLDDFSGQDGAGCRNDHIGAKRRSH